MIATTTKSSISVKPFTLLDIALYKIDLINEGELHGEPLSLIFFQRMENHLLRNKFGANIIKTQEFIDWALENRLLRQNIDEV